MTQLGQYPPARHILAHLSDTHLLAAGRPLYGVVDTDSTLVRALDQLERSKTRPRAIVVTGDLTDLAEPDAYRRLRALVEPAAERMGSRIVWVMGNHDERPAFSLGLFDAPSIGPQDRVEMIEGLRIIALDTSVPGFHHGELSSGQLDWLREVLAEPAPEGTILAMHHPPLPSPVEIMAILELQEQDRLAEILRGSDVRAILAGHLHVGTHGSFAGIPVSVAAATCYTIDVSGAVGTLRGVDAGQTMNLVHVYDDGIVHSIVPIVDAPVVVVEFDDNVLERLAAMTFEERMAAFSDKTSTFNRAEADSSRDAREPTAGG